MKKAAVSSILLQWCCLLLRDSQGAAAEESPPDRIPICCLRFQLTRTASRHSGRVCASLGTWRGITLSLSIDMRMENSIAFPSLRPNSCVSR